MPTNDTKTIATEVKERAASWWQRWKSHVYAALTGIGAVLLAILLWKSRSKGPDTFGASLEVTRERKQLAKLAADRDAALEAAEEVEPVIAELDKDILASKRKIVELHDRKDLPDDEIEKAFEALGF